MAVTLLEARTQVRDQGGFDTTHTGTAMSDIDGALNHYHRRMVGKSKWRKSQVTIGTTVVDQTEYSLSDDIIDLEGILVGSVPYQKISQRRLWDLRGGYAQILGPGPRAVYAQDFSSSAGKQIEIYPAPDTAGDAITGLVALYPVDLTGDANTFIVPDEYVEEGIVDGAIGMLLRRDDERDDRAQLMEQIFRDRTEALRRQMNSRVGSGPFQIPVRYP